MPEIYIFPGILYRGYRIDRFSVKVKIKIPEVGYILSTITLDNGSRTRGFRYTRFSLLSLRTGLTGLRSIAFGIPR